MSKTLEQIKKLEGLVKKLQDSRENLKRISEGGFLGIGHQRTGGAYLGTKSDFVGDTVRQHPVYGGVLSGGKKRGRPKKVSMAPECACGGNFVGGDFAGGSQNKVYRHPAKRPVGQPVDAHENQSGGVRSGGVRSGGVRSGGVKKLAGSGSKTSAKHNPWIKHVQAYAKKHNIPYQLAVSEARATYKAKAK